MGKKKVCMVFNDLALYRRAIYKELDEAYDCDWFIEDIDTGVKEFDASELKRVTRLPVKSIGPFYIIKGMIGLLRKNYDRFFVLGETGNVSLFFFGILKHIFYKEKRIYYWTHGYYGKESRFELFFWKRPLFKLADGLFPYSNYCKTLMVKDGFNPDIIHPIHNSLAYREQLLLREKMRNSGIFENHFGNDAPVLIMIGRLNLRKHLDMLFYAVSCLKSRGENYNIVLIGDGEDRNKLEELAEQVGLKDRTWFYGACYDEKTNAELLYNADMCVVPGDIGLTAIHALMFGVPAITHNCYMYQGPEFEAIKSGITGDFYEYGSVDSLADTISKWFKNNYGGREKVREACYSEIDNYWTPDYQMRVINKYLL